MISISIKSQSHHTIHTDLYILFGPENSAELSKCLGGELNYGDKFYYIFIRSPIRANTAAAPTQSY